MKGQKEDQVGKRWNYPKIIFILLLVVVPLLMMCMAVSMSIDRKKAMARMQPIVIQVTATPHQIPQPQDQTQAQVYTTPLPTLNYSGPCEVYVAPIIENGISKAAYSGEVSIWAEGNSVSSTGIKYEGNYDFPQPRMVAVAKDVNENYLWVQWKMDVNPFFQCKNANGQLDTGACVMEGWTRNFHLIKSNPAGCISSLPIKQGTLLNMTQYEWVN